MRVLILGGSGYIGSHAAEELLRLGYKVRVFSRSFPGLLPPLVCSHPNFEAVVGDLACPTACQEALKDCSCVIHCIGTCSPAMSLEDPMSDWQQQVQPTVALLRMLRDIQPLRLIFISSGGTVYGPDAPTPTSETSLCRPVCPYGIHKLVIENYLYQEHFLHGLNYLILRLSNPYGGRQRPKGLQGAPSVFLNKVLRGEPIHLWGDGSVKRDFLHISDFVRALAIAVSYEGSERILNVGSSLSLSLSDLIQRIELLTRRQADVRLFPARPFDVAVSELDISLIASEFKWKPMIDLDAGLTLSLTRQGLNGV